MWHNKDTNRITKNIRVFFSYCFLAHLRSPRKFCSTQRHVNLLTVLQPHCHSDNNSWELTRLLLVFCWTSSDIPTLPTDAPDRPNWYCLSDRTVLHMSRRRDTLLLEVRLTNLRFSLDLTTSDRTLNQYLVSPAFDQSPWYHLYL